MQEKELIIHTLESYNASRLLACDIVTGKQFRRMRRKGLV